MHIIPFKIKQEEYVLSCINPNNMEIVKREIMMYDLGNSLNKILITHLGNYEKMIEEKDKFLLEREKYLSSLISKYKD